MAEKFLSDRNLRFLLYEVLDIEALTRYPYFEDHTRETFDLVIDTAMKIGREVLLPLFAEMDRQPPRFEDGELKVHPKVGAFMRQCGEDGWIGASAPYELDGQQLPGTIAATVAFIFGAANFSASVYPFLSTGAAHLIESFGSEEQKAAYIPKMFAGQWQGTMALTEPQAGSSLSDVATTVVPDDQGFYRLTGQKIFISAGDHDGVENVVHLMLAKIKGAPAGVKGISLFIVPKKRVAEDGSLVSNDITLVGTFHKMGYKGCPITQLSLGENNDCRGYLVGEPHQGLRYMFQMMNEARIGVGMQADSIASAAYYASLEYARERPQGRPIASKDPADPPVPIIEHADVKRMLLFQRAVVEGALALLLACWKYADLVRVTDEPDRRRYALLLDILTPVAKTYPSEMGVLSVSQAVQILGGYGYCDEFPMEQYYRDMRIHPIHEGTTGIQGLDLLGRKVVMKNGAAFQVFGEEVKAAIAQSYHDPVLQPYAHRLETAFESLTKVTEHLVGFALQGRIEPFLADATLYLEMFGIVAVAWQWLEQGLAIQKGLEGSPAGAEAEFYQGKLYTMKYFFHYELPKIEGLSARLLEDAPVTAGLDVSFFND